MQRRFALLGSTAFLALLALASLRPAVAGEAYDLSREIRLAPGESYAVRYDPRRRELVEEEPGRGFGGLGEKALLQVLRAPRWLRADLADTLVELARDVIDVGDDASPAFHDVDGDGRADLVVGNGAGILRCYLAPWFKEDAGRFASIRVGAGAHPCFFDLDGDGAAELLVGDSSGGLHAWSLGNSVRELDLGLLPFSGPVHPAAEGKELLVGDGTGGVWRYTREKTFASVPAIRCGDNGAFARATDAAGATIRLRGSKEGVLLVDPGDRADPERDRNLARIRVAGNARPVFHDVDGDGALDLAVGSSDGTLRVFPNRAGPGGLWFATYSEDAPVLFPNDVGYLSSPRLADLDGDGVVDLVSGSNDGRLRFFAGPDYRDRSEVLSALRFKGAVVPAPGDFNGDRKMDLAVGLESGEVRVFLGPGFTMDEALSRGLKVDSFAAPTACDFDGDGLTDLLVGGEDGKIRLFRGAPKGFVESPAFFGALDAGRTPMPAGLDANGDGAMDLVVGNRAGEVRVFLAPRWDPLPGGLGVGLRAAFACPGFGDRNGDGVPEMVLGSVKGDFLYFEKDPGGWVEKRSWSFQGEASASNSPGTCTTGGSFTRGCTWRSRSAWTHPSGNATPRSAA